MHRWTLVSACLILALASGVAAAPSGEDAAVAAARDAALRIGRALRGADLSALRPMLPERGKVQLSLDALGPADGSYSAGQVEALLGDFFEHGSVRSFDLLGVEHHEGSFALARGRVLLTDRNGRPARVDLHLAFEPEAERWVLREIRETRP